MHNSYVPHLWFTLVINMVDVNGLPPLPKCFSETEITHLDSQPEQEESTQRNQNVVDGQNVVNGDVHESEKQDYTKVNGTANDSEVEEKPRSPYSRLNHALSKLREEMVGY